jgi:hypothetical protein
MATSHTHVCVHAHMCANISIHTIYLTVIPSKLFAVKCSYSERVLPSVAKTAYITALPKPENVDCIIIMVTCIIFSLYVNKL